MALGILAILAIMATTFLTLARLEARVAANYVDDQRCEMLALGAMNYFKSILRDDLDRTWAKYENRDAAVGAVGWVWSGTGGRIKTECIPGLGEAAYGVPVSNDFWFNAPFQEWTDWGSLFTGEWGSTEMRQLSFNGGTSYSRGVVARYWDTKDNRDVDLWIGRTLCSWGPNGTVVHEGHPAAGSAIDFDADGEPRPPCNNNSGPFYNQEQSDTQLYFDTGAFVLFSGDSYYHPGTTLTDERTLPRGLSWRWAVKLGVPHNMYIDLNTAGNLDGNDSGYLNNMGQLSLAALRSDDEATSTNYAGSSRQLGRLRWKGYSGEYQFGKGGFPSFYDEVAYHPSQVSLEKLFDRDKYAGVGYVVWDNDTSFNLAIDRSKARALLEYRVGPDGKAADGGDRYRPGWRRDGATYYRFATPENPLGDDRFFGMNEVIEHDHAAYNPATSEVPKWLSPGEWRQLRPHVTMWSADTILRGKIWPTEGRLPWRPNATPGDWRHIDILKRVNINIIGANGPEGLTGEDALQKTRWLQKRARERDRLYYMLVAGLKFGNASNPEHSACQFIASLADMVDWDQNETLYVAPDGSNNWALGVEKQPVISEVALYAAPDARIAADGYALSHLRLELYNPMENIPWIRDNDEAIDISDYRLTINAREYRLSDMKSFSTTDFNTPQGTPASLKADGLYGLYPNGTLWHPTMSPAPAVDPTWTRYLHIGWDTNVPPDMAGAAGSPTMKAAIQDFKNGVTIGLWKPIRDPAAQAGIPEDGVNVRTVLGVKCICVDKTEVLRLLPPYNSATQGPGSWNVSTAQTTYLGIYRRWDPMNARVYGLIPDGVNERNNILWLPGWDPWTFATMGRPNGTYPRTQSPASATSSWTRATWESNGKDDWSLCRYYRYAERNFKVVDGDLPSIGWLGELMMRNAAQDGPLTWVHSKGQEPLGVISGLSANWWYIERDKKMASELDVKAKFDLFRPFQSAGVYQPLLQDCRTENLQMLDIFTVWDPSNDGIDNDGDGAVDDDDTGLQPGDKGGPEVRVFGRVDLNNVSRRVCSTIFPDNAQAFTIMDGHGNFTKSLKYGRMWRRAPYISGGGTNAGWGPIETIGDLLRADVSGMRPGAWLAGGGATWIDGSIYPPPPDPTGTPVAFRERGFTDLKEGSLPLGGDDDGDGICDERDERDVIFTWVSNYLTTRSNVFEIDLMVTVSDPPYYPGSPSGAPRELPFRTFKVQRVFARKQIIGILDRSTCLRVLGSSGSCDFSGPVDVRMLRFTDDKRTY